MRGRFTSLAVLTVLLISRFSICLATESSDPNSSTKYLDAVRTFADNVLKYGRDNYGPKHTPLFVDGLNIHTHEPVKWISPEGERWILSNLASQQTFFRTLVGLTEITGDPKYKQAAMDATKYAFENLRHPNGLLYCGYAVAYDAETDDLCGVEDRHHTFKLNYPYYYLMWQVNPEATEMLIEAFWSAHILDWSNLDMDRIGYLGERFKEPWNHEYKRGPMFFKSRRINSSAMISTGTSLIHAGTTLYRLLGQEQPLVWSKRLAKRYVDTRHPNTGISYENYNARYPTLGDDLKEHFDDPRTTYFPYCSFDINLPYYYPENIQAHPWMCLFLVGEMLGYQGKEFTQWALEELTAWGKASYRKKDNSFVPILTDGTNLEGYVWKEAPGTDLDGFVVKPCPVDMPFFWAYSVAYRTTQDGFMWQMVRDIALGNNFGDIGQTPAHPPTQLQTETSCASVYGLLGFLELHAKTKKQAYLEMARRIGDNILSSQFDKGFFIESKRHIYTRFDCFEPLVLLHLDAAMKHMTKVVPEVWPNLSLFVFPYRHKEQGIDRQIIYTLTESPEPSMSLQEVAAVGNVDELKFLLAKGLDVNGREDSFLKTALHHAAIAGHRSIAELLLTEGANIDVMDLPAATPLHYTAEKGHKEVAELLITNGADVNAKKASGDTPLHSAVRSGHKDIIELLISNGADVNVKNDDGQVPIDTALAANRKDVIDLLVEKGAVPSSIHAAANFGVLTGVKALLEQGVAVDAQDDKGMTPLNYAVQGGHKELAELLIANGADINSKDKEGSTSLYYAVSNEDKDMVEFLVTKGADVHLVPEKGYPLLSHAVWSGNRDIVELLVAHGARFDVKDQYGFTAFRSAASRGNRELVEFFVAKGADISSFHMAACMGDLARVESFVEEGADVDIKDERGWTPLYWAASTGHEEVAKFLIANGANVDVGANNNRTPLHQAARSGWRKLAELFISEGAEVDVKDRGGDTPLHRAASAGHRAVVDLLIAKGANVNEKDRDGQSPLYRAVQQGHKDVVEVLVAKGADINAKVTKLNQTFLHIVIVRGRKDIAELLIAKGIDVNSKDVNGQTPLHLSARRGSRDTVELLIANGADMNAKNRWNRTPLDLAANQGHTEIVELLNKHTTDPMSTTLGPKSVRLSPDNAGGLDNISDLTITGPSKSYTQFGNHPRFGDVNGDGYEDLLVAGASRYNNNTGRLYLYYGGKRVDNKPDKIFTGENAGDKFGEEAYLADVNGDNYADVITGSPTYNNWQGRTYIFFGGPDMDTNADLIIDGEAGTQGRFGNTITAGDVNNDGYADVVTSAIYYNNRTGRVYLFYGGDPMDTTVDLIFDGENEYDRFGRDIENPKMIGDVNGDGYNDLLISTRTWNFWEGVSGQGRAYLYYGGPGTSMDSTVDKIFTGENERDDFGVAGCIFDIDNDGFDDVIIGARNYKDFQGIGRVYLYWGGQDMDTIADQTYDGEVFSQFQSRFGTGLDAGYVNDDDYGDIVVAAPFYNGEPWPGRAYLFYGDSKAQIDTMCDMTFTIPLNSGLSWTQHVALGDVHNDDYPDLAIGGCMYNEGQGRVWIYFNKPPKSK